MRARYNESFKQQAVEKALSRPEGHDVSGDHRFVRDRSFNAAQVDGEIQKPRIRIKFSP